MRTGEIDGNTGVAARHRGHLCIGGTARLGGPQAELSLSANQARSDLYMIRKILWRETVILGKKIANGL